MTEMNDIPVFPVGSGYMRGPHGMSLRDYFAAKAMQSLLSDPEYIGFSRKEIAQRAYYMADTMLLAREG